MSDTSLLDLAAAGTERDLQILLKAKLEAQNAYLREPDSDELKRAWLEAKKHADAAEDRHRRLTLEKGKEERRFANVRQAHLYLTGECGFQVAYNTLKKAMDSGEVAKRRGGGWTKAALDKWALPRLAKRLNASPEADAPPPAPESGMPASSERKVERQADLLDVKVARERMEFAREMGRLTETATVEAELAARARAFRLGLERFGSEQAEAVAALFGGNGKNAAELARRLGLDEEEARAAVPLIVDFCASRAPAFGRFWKTRVEDFLDAYATGHWWTDDMRAAWKKYEEHQNTEVPGVHD